MADPIARPSASVPDAPETTVVPAVAPALFWLCAAAMLIPVWLPAQFPTEDGPGHLHWVEVFRALGDPGHPLQAFFTRHLTWDAPHHLGHFALQYGLAAVLEPHAAQKLVVTIVIALWAFSLQFASRALTGTISVGALTGLLLVHGAWLYGGYFAHLLAMPLVVLALGILVTLEQGPPGSRPWRYLVLGVLGMLAYFTHFFVAALFLLLVGFWVVSARGGWAHRLHLVFTAAPTAGLVGWHLSHGSLGGSVPQWEPVSTAAARFVGLAFFRGLGAPTLSFWLALALLAALLAGLCWSALRGCSSPPGPSHRRIAILAALGAVLFFLAPESVGEAGNFNGRIQLAMWAWLLPSLPWRISPRGNVLAIAVALLLLAWQCTTFTLRGLRFNREYASILAAAAEQIPAGTVIRSVLPYEDARYEGSFIRILAHLPEDIAFRRRAVLVDSYFPSTAFYWVRPKPGMPTQPDLLLSFRRRQDGTLTLHVIPTR